MTCTELIPYHFYFCACVSSSKLILFVEAYGSRCYCSFRKYCLGEMFVKATAALNIDACDEVKQNKLKAFCKGFILLNGIKTINKNIALK